MPTKTPSVKSVLVIAASCVALGAAFVLTAPAGTQRKPVKAPAGIHKIKHVIVIMQENRSFDHYFGTFPGADGFPTTPSGEIDVCVPDPVLGGCSRPYETTSQYQQGGPHDEPASQVDVNGGRMDGFIGVVATSRQICLGSHLRRT